MTTDFQREYLLRLPLPLAQLYSRAFNAKDPRGRHDNAFYLCEALIKLAVAPAIAGYLDEVQRGAPRVPTLDRELAALALPSLGQWVAMLRALARHFSQRPDAAAHPLGHLGRQLDSPRRDWPGVLALHRRIKNGPDGQPAGDQSCSLLQFLDSLVQYRNGVFGHGGPRFEAFYEQEMGPLLAPALNELLAEGTFDLLGPRGSRLVYLTELRTVDEDRVAVGLRELVGLQGERLAPLELSAAQATALLPNRVAVLWPGRPVPLRLDPLLLYRESETAEEVLFLNRDRNGRQVEYLSYTTGRTERDRAAAPALAALLSQVVNRPVSEADLQALAEQSRMETPSLEFLLPAVPSTGRVLGDYEILAEIGRGGMGVVYLARQMSLGRLVALKMLPADVSSDEVALARFRREIRHLARCDHPNIVKVLASGAFADGQVYYAMEFVPGCDLEQVWRELTGLPQSPATSLGNSTWARTILTASRKRREQTTSKADPTAVPGTPDSVLGTLLPPLPELPSAEDDPGGFVRRVMQLGRDAALALQAVHDQGIIHRDIKPANLMVTPDGGRVVVMDFGLAKGQSLALTASRSGGFLGTLRYAAPEQLAAATLKVGPAADVRALGGVLWELLTRRRLFTEAEDEAQLAVKVHDEDVPRLRSVDPGLDRDLEAIVARATERRLADRIPTAGQLAEYLQLALDGRPLPIRPPGTAELVWRWVRSHKAVVAAAAAAVMLVLTTLVLLSVGYTLLAKEQARTRQAERNRALAQVEALLDTNPAAVPSLLQTLDPFRREVEPRLRELRDQPELADKRRVRVSLALLPAEPGEVAYLRERLLAESDPPEMLLIRDALKGHAKELVEELWVRAGDAGLDAGRRFRALVALAGFADPDDRRWAAHGDLIVGQLLAANPLHLGSWTDALRPVRRSLLPPLARVFRDKAQAEQRQVAANILADYAADQPSFLTDLLLDADERQFAIILPNLAGHRHHAIRVFSRTVEKSLEAEKQPENREQLGKRQANAAVALIRLGELGKVRPLLIQRWGSDPRSRSHLIHRFAPLGADPNILLGWLQTETEVSVRRALVLSLGEFGADRLSNTQRAEWVPLFIKWYREDPDPGMHGAVEWLLRRWDRQSHLQLIDGELASGKVEGQRSWYINRQRQTMVVLRGNIFPMGSPPTETGRDGQMETLHQERIEQSFAIGAKEVTMRDFNLFRKQHRLNEYRLNPALPVSFVSWYDAAAYCNWLSEREQIPTSEWCYIPNENGQYAEGMRVVHNYLKRSGYRLPTEAEWEYACRSGSWTSRHYGETDELLPKYGWYTGNSQAQGMVPGGTLKPNDLGLFDMLGNAAEWCHASYLPYPLGINSLTSPDVDGDRVIRDKPNRLIRGGSFLFQPRDVRSARRNDYPPATGSRSVGFRLARTIPESSAAAER
jgi:serine/threonine protein kinase/formylglycine-generating enzyme required for sulfatase activity